MADLRYTVEIDTRGAVSAVDGLRSSINGLASALALRELASFADSLTNIRNKLITVSDSVDVANKQFDAFQMCSYLIIQVMNQVGFANFQQF